MPKTVSAQVKAARDILRGQSLEPREMLALAKELKAEKQFGLARRLLARARQEPSLADDAKLHLEVCQQSALCTYKDPDLQADSRLDRALDILRQSREDINTTTNQETLGITGAIYKRKWELDNQKQQLERALNYYLRGYAQGPATDQGYTGINAAFVLDLLAHQEEAEARKASVVSEVAARRRTEAGEIRREIVRQVAPLVDKAETNWLQGKWWFYSTVAEAHFGLGEYDEAIAWLERGRQDAAGRNQRVPPWEYESTARQLASLARLQPDAATDAAIDAARAPASSAPAASSHATSSTASASSSVVAAAAASASGGDGRTRDALKALERFFDKQEVQSAYTGKVGLALSGGGFRASLFHIGVLARLAELDVLHRVEVLSCVSGGSIIGAHYYLEVRKLLQSKPDARITRDDYIEIVARVRRDFLNGVQRNVRTRVAANPFVNLKMIFPSGYSRTMRAGELYESEIFSRVEDGGGDAPRLLNGLYTCPARDDGQPDEDFNFKTDNWRRRAKIPNLILNATSLNTGHNWQFTASWMGEPPAGIDNQIDGNDRLRRLYYDAEDTPEAHRQVRLGHAVAASACVPGLFEPLVLDNLYPERIVRLVDGGVCDNQGVASLLEQDCTVILVSDGSGQMRSENQPSKGLLGVPLRSNSILQARVREAQYHELSARQRASLLRGFMFVHLKDDLDVDPVDWIGCLDPFEASDDSRPPNRRGPLTRYGIAKDIQELLAGVRTDLDSFSDLEAFALMTSAYRMTEHEFKYSKCLEGFPEPGEQYAWDFLAVEEAMKGAGRKYEYLKKQLGASGTLAFKVWKLSTPLKVMSWLLGIAFVVLCAFMFYYLFDYWRETSTGRVLTLVAVGLAVIGASAFVLVSLLGCLAAHLHLAIFDWLFLRYGSIKTLQSK